MDPPDANGDPRYLKKFWVSLLLFHFGSILSLSLVVEVELGKMHLFLIHIFEVSRTNIGCLGILEIAVQNNLVV